MNAPTKQYQILFVDDDPDFLAMIQDFFATLGEQIWQIHCATSADQALEILKVRKMDLVVSDVNMPMLDGIQFLHILNRSHPDLKKAVITPMPPRKNAPPAWPKAPNCSSKNRARRKD